jgi:hypothetical protein
MDVRKAVIENYIIKRKIAEKKLSSNKTDVDEIKSDSETLN